MDTRKNKGISGAGLLVLVVFLFAVLWFTNMFENQSDRLTWSEFQTLVTGDNVDSISVIQNKNVPTGHVEIKLKKEDKDGKQVRYLYVSDINDNNFAGASYTCRCDVHFYDDEPSGRKCRKQSHELWKEPCKVKHRQRQEGYI